MLVLLHEDKSTDGKQDCDATYDASENAAKDASGMRGDDPGRATYVDPSEDSNAGGEKTEEKVDAKNEGGLDGTVEGGGDEQIKGDFSVGENGNNPGAPQEAVQLDEHVDGPGRIALIVNGEEDGGGDDNEEAGTHDPEPKLDH